MGLQCLTVRPSIRRSNRIGTCSLKWLKGIIKTSDTKRLCPLQKKRCPWRLMLQTLHKSSEASKLRSISLADYSVPSMVLLTVGGRDNKQTAELVSTDGASSCSSISVPDYPTIFYRGIAAVVSGRPLFCFGDSDNRVCHEYEFSTGSWSEVSNLVHKIICFSLGLSNPTRTLLNWFETF